MAITYRTSTSGGGTSGTVDRTPTGTTAVGDLWVILASIAGNTNTAPTCSVDNGGTYTLVGTALFNVSGSMSCVFVRDQLFANTTSTTVTVASGSNTAGTINIIMCAGSLRT